MTRPTSSSAASIASLLWSRKTSNGGLMSNLNRREFLQQSMMAAAAASVPMPLLANTRRAGPNDVLRIAVCGVKGRGLAHVGEWAAMKDVQVAAICDIDENQIHNAMSVVEKKAGNKPVYYQDYRKLMEDKSIDAVSVATDR